MRPVLKILMKMMGAPQSLQFDICQVFLSRTFHSAPAWIRRIAHHPACTELPHHPDPME
jgi:hypothetical protein